MYAIPSRELMYEQSESALVAQGRVLVSVSNDSVRSQASQGLKETLSPNQDGTFSYGAASEQLGSEKVTNPRSVGKFFSKFRPGLCFFCGC